MKLQLRKSTTILSISLIAGVFSLGFVISQLGNKVQAIGDSGRLVTIHDRGQEKVLLTESQTIADVLKEAEITVDSHDAVEPALDQKLVAREYHVNIYRARPVTIVDGPMRQKVVTPYQTAERIIHDAGIELYDEDEATMSRNDNILADGAGLQLTVDRATAFNLNLFGTTTTVRTQGTTLADMLKEKDIPLQADDRASVDLSTPILAGMEVKIWREGKQTVTAEVAVPFATEQIRDADREPDPDTHEDHREAEGCAIGQHPVTEVVWVVLCLLIAGQVAGAGRLAAAGLVGGSGGMVWQRVGGARHEAKHAVLVILSDNRLLGLHRRGSAHAMSQCTTRRPLRADKVRMARMRQSSEMTWN